MLQLEGVAVVKSAWVVAAAAEPFGADAAGLFVADAAAAAGVFAAAAGLFAAGDWG